MVYDPLLHNRRSIRLPGYEYTRPGAYFITIVTYNRRHIFGDIAAGEMRLNACGIIARMEWLKTAVIRREIELDEFVVMPDHLHAIVIVKKRDDDFAVDGGQFVGAGGIPTVGADGRQCAGADDIPTVRADGGQYVGADDIPTVRADGGRYVVGAEGRPPLRRLPRSLGSIIAGYKSAVTARINRQRQTPGVPVWQRNYYDRIVRNENELFRFREYIRNNPIRWETDANTRSMGGCEK
jgi:REP-associated tyrosine transposase